MNTFSVHYIGQLRFYECMLTHRKITNRASSIYCTVSPDIKEVWNASFKARHSVYEKSLNQIIDEIRSYQSEWLTDFKLLTERDYSEVSDPNTIKFWPCNYFFTLGKSLRDDGSDFSIFITTDLIFCDESTLDKMVNQYVVTSVPTLYCENIDNNNELINTQVICINSSARRLIIENWKHALEQVRAEDHEHILRNEYITFRAIQLCGISCFKKLSINNSIVRFRSNMSLEDIDYQILDTQYREYSKEKREFINARNKKSKQKNKDR